MSAVVIADGGKATAISVKWVGEADTRKWSTSYTAETYGAVAESRSWSTSATSSVNVGGTPYDGDYLVEPGEQDKTLHTRGRTLAQDIVVGKIPSNYGLITWNGSTLTVS